MTADARVVGDGPTESGGVITDKTAAHKGHIKPGTKVSVMNPEPGVVEALGLEEPAFVGASQAQLILLFVRSCAELNADLPATVEALLPGAVVWVLFRRGSKAAGFDMNRDDVWAAAESLGLRPLGLIGIDGVWSAFRLRPGDGQLGIEAIDD